jgi:hypothetical protein
MIVIKKVAPVGSSIRSSVASLRFFHDKALQWARENPVLAQACLDIPSSATDDNSVFHRDTTASEEKLDPRACSPIHSFDEYWKKRGWSFERVVLLNERALARSLTTHVLTAPLTLASYLRRLYEPRVPSGERTSDAHNASPSGFINICCVGARAEASLPLQYWREVLVVLKWTSQRNVRVLLDFVGPDVTLRPPAELEYRGSCLRLRWAFAGKFHDFSKKSGAGRMPHYHGHVLYNPGLGHSNLKADWIPTIDLLLDHQLRRASEQATVLLTAHSELDAARESTYLNDSFGVQAVYAENPFASQITYEDPFDHSHVVRPNHYVACL